MTAAPARNRKGWRLASAAWAAAIFLGAMIPIGPEASAGHLDKLVHVCEYLLFAWLLANALPAGEAKGPRPALPAFLLATAYGALLELLQGFVPWRSMDLLDAAVNAAGAAAGAWLSRRIPTHRA